MPTALDATSPELRTARLLLRRWRPRDLEPFAALNADPVVMEHFPSTLTRAASDAVVERAEQSFDEHGCGWFAVETTVTLTSRSPGTVPAGMFVGFVGLTHPRFDAHFTPAVEIGWRLARPAWGHGVASEAARQVIADGFARLGLTEIVSFTTVDNLRSQAVMQRIGMSHDPSDDFDHPALAPDDPLCRHVLYRIRHAHASGGSGDGPR